MILIFSILILVMSVVIHEVSHGYAAYIQGDSTAEYEGRLTLNPIAHLDLFGSIIVPVITSLSGFPFGWAKPVPFNPYNLRNQRWGEFFVAIAGPAANFLIAIIFGLIIRFGAGSLPVTFVGLALQVVIINISLGIFNMIPVPPLDGSKVLFGFLPVRFSRIRWQLERYALVIVFIIILVPVFTELLGRAVTYLTVFVTGLPLSSLVQYLQF